MLSFQTLSYYSYIPHIHSSSDYDSLYSILASLFLPLLSTLFSYIFSILIYLQPLYSASICMIYYIHVSFSSSILYQLISSHLHSSLSAQKIHHFSILSNDVNGVYISISQNLYHKLLFLMTISYLLLQKTIFIYF